MLAPSRKDEKAIVQMLRGLQDYQKLLDASDGEAARAALIQGLSDIARGLQKLIQGPLGRLDPDLLNEELEAFIRDSNLSLVGHEGVVAGPEETAAPSATRVG